MITQYDLLNNMITTYKSYMELAEGFYGSDLDCSLQNNINGLLVDLAVIQDEHLWLELMGASQEDMVELWDKIVHGKSWELKELHVGSLKVQ